MAPHSNNTFGDASARHSINEPDLLKIPIHIYNMCYVTFPTYFCLVVTNEFVQNQQFNMGIEHMVKPLLKSFNWDWVHFVLLHWEK